MKSTLCAIYTRKSSEEGLEQEFNSLDAQREACVAYIASQKHEGWQLLPAIYDDGGYSGGNMERPALKSLMQEISAGNVDVIVVYKVDRLTRSLADFAKMVEVLDKHNVSFVSITQQFNTTTSMGRLTLNVLLSFAQFEREVTGERIRDKIAASKQKGMWMGGTLALGYDCKDRKLIINEPEAKIIRHIYNRYLELRSVNLLKLELDIEGYRAKIRIDKNSKKSGGLPLYKGNLYHMLRNRIYIGEIVHKDKHYPGEHPPIIDLETFKKVQECLAENRMVASASIGSISPSLLAGKLFDDKGNYMTPKHSNTRKRHYRYYTSQAIIQSRHYEAGSLPNIPAYEIEHLVKAEILNFLKDKSKLQEYFKEESIDKQQRFFTAIDDILKLWQNSPEEQLRIFIRQILSKAIIAKNYITLTICATNLLLAIKAQCGEEKLLQEALVDTDSPIIINKPVLLAATQSGNKVVTGANLPPEANNSLIKAIAKAHLWNAQLLSGEVQTLQEIATRENITSASYIRIVMHLQFLAPDITEAILTAMHPRNLTFEKLIKVARIHDWEKQREVLGI